MAAYSSTKERTNYARLCCAIIDLGTDALRDSMCSQVLPIHVKTKLMNCPKPDRMSARIRPNQWTCIDNAASVGSYKEFDITLLCLVFRLFSVQDLRDTLKVQINPKDIYSTASNCPALTTDPVTKLTPDELLTVRHAATFGSYENCKDDLLWKLYKHLFSVPYPNIHPTMPWGISNMPNVSHKTLGDDIERIRVIRNTVYGHISTTEIADQDFNAHWACLEDIVKRLDRRYPGNGYKKKLDDIKYSSMDEAQEKFWWDQMKKLADEDTLTYKQIAESNTKIDNLSQATAEQFKISNTKIDNLSQTTAKQFKVSNTKIDNLSQTTAKRFKESYSRIDNFSKTTSEKLEESNTKIDILSKMTTEQFEESKTKVEILYKRTDEQFNKIDNLSKTTTEQFEETSIGLITFPKRRLKTF